MMGIHAYYPTRRSAYGPRQPRRYVNDAEGMPARELRDWGKLAPYLESTPMPCGGRRWYARCASCGRRCEKVYYRMGAWDCRRCAGLVYWSQYDGRRIEASLSRVYRYLLNGGGAHRAIEARTTWLERELQHDARAWASMAITQFNWERYLARVEAMQHWPVRPSAIERATIIDLRQRWHALSRRRNRRAA